MRKLYDLILPIVALLICLSCVFVKNKQEKEYIVVSGKVYKGKEEGRSFAFPSANIKVKTIEHKLGLYACLVKIEDEDNYRKAICYSDSRDPHKLEAHIFDFLGNLYGKTIEMKLIKYMRPSMNFKKNADLIAQIDKDKPKVFEALKDF